MVFLVVMKLVNRCSTGCKSASRKSKDEFVGSSPNSTKAKTLLIIGWIREKQPRDELTRTDTSGLHPTCAALPHHHDAATSMPIAIIHSRTSI